MPLPSLLQSFSRWLFSVCGKEVKTVQSPSWLAISSGGKEVKTVQSPSWLAVPSFNAVKHTKCPMDELLELTTTAWWCLGESEVFRGLRQYLRS